MDLVELLAWPEPPDQLPNVARAPQAKLLARIEVAHPRLGVSERLPDRQAPRADGHEAMGVRPLADEV
jgi:hypothetical protein